MSRADCLRWMADHGYPQPPKSSCYFCPYHSDAHWQRMKDQQPYEWQRAVEFERDIQRRAREEDNVMKGAPYLHSARVPLDQVVLNPKDDYDFDVVCGLGMCGV